MAGSYNKLVELLENAIAAKRNLVNTLVDKGEEASFNEPLTDLMQKAGDYIPKSYIFVDESGNEIPGVLVDQETVFTATANDIREGKVAASALGVVTGEKEIPSYNTTEGYVLVPAGSVFRIILAHLNKYDYTKLQAIICKYSGSIAGSVEADKISINDKVYATNSTTVINTVTKDEQNKAINLGITNDSNSLYLLRFFTFKEIE